MCCHGNICCSLLDYLKKEAHLLAGLEGLGIPRGYHSNLLSLQVHPQHTSFAIDIRSDSVLVSHVTAM